MTSNFSFMTDKQGSKKVDREKAKSELECPLSVHPQSVIKLRQIVEI
jgi:hypothetical protein